MFIKELFAKTVEKDLKDLKELEEIMARQSDEISEYEKLVNQMKEMAYAK